MKKVLLISPLVPATEMLLERTRSAIEKQALRIEISAMPEAQGRESINDFEIVLLSPHLRFLLNSKELLLANEAVPIEVISSIDFGNLNGEAVVELIKPHL